MPFHRLTVPTYFGGLPAGYDYLNTPSDPSVGGSGSPANADGKKSGGDNDGTYFVAWTEDGTSEHFNRPAKALGQNTDFIDDTLRSSIPKFAQLDATAAGAVTTVALTGQIFVGEFGMANNATNRNLLVHVTDQATNDDLEVGGTKITASLIHDGASANVVGTAADGFRTNASVNFSPAIPNGTNYRVWYGVRSSLNEIARTEKGAYFKYIMRITEHINGTLRGLLRQLHSEASVNQAYTDPWDSTIRSLASSGLDDRYRRSTLQPAGFTTGQFNKAGDGAVILRDGPAVEIKGTTGYQFSGVTWPDGNKATLKLGVFDPRSNSSTFISDNDGGDFGVWHESEWKPLNNVIDAAMFHRFRTAGIALIDAVPYDMRSATFQALTLKTVIDASSATATLNPDSVNSTTARRTVQCGAGQYFCLTAPTRTAIRLGIDLLEVTDSSGKVRTFIIQSILSATRVLVIGYGGFAGTNLFAATAEAGCKIRVIQVQASIGGPLSFANNGVFKRPLLVIPPANLTTAPASEDIPGCSFFGAQTGSVIDATAAARRARALEWGATASPDSGGTVDGTVTPRGWLNGDGSISATALTLTTGDLTIALGGITISTGGIISANDIRSNDDLVADDDVIAGDRVVAGGNLEVTGGGTIDRLAITSPNSHLIVDEDWIRATQNFSPNVIWTHKNTWLFNEITGSMTLNNGTPSSKNPGQLQIIGGGGGSAKKLSIYPTSQFPYAFANFDLMVIVAAVTDAGGNAYAALNVGLSNSTTAQGTNNLSLTYIHGVGWALIHVVGGVLGAHHLQVLGAQANGVFVHVRFVKQANGDIQVFYNFVLATTILAAEVPTGLCTFVQFYEQTAGDPSATTWTVDYSFARFGTNADRSGA